MVHAYDTKELLPDYIPAHLKGRVSDIREEPDGTVSFLDAHRNDNLGTLSAARTRIDRDQYNNTFVHNSVIDPRNSSSVATQMRNMYASPTKDNSANMLTSIADVVTGKASDGVKALRGSAGPTAAAGLLSALAGGGLGAYYANSTGDDNMAPYALGGAAIAGLLGAGTTALLNRNTNNAVNEYRGITKRAGTQQNEMLGLLIRTINADYTLNPAQRAQIINAATRATETQSVQLSNLLRTGTGAGVGVLIARALGLTGITGMLAGGLLGAAGANFFGGSKPSRNAFGQLFIG